MTNKYLNNKHNLKILNSNALIYINFFFSTVFDTSQLIKERN